MTNHHHQTPTPAVAQVNEDMLVMQLVLVTQLVLVVQHVLVALDVLVLVTVACCVVVLEDVDAPTQLLWC